MQTATFAKRRHNAESIRGIHPEAIPIDNINGRETSIIVCLKIESILYK